MFTILQELQLVESNPARLVKKLSEKSGERQVYIGFPDFNRIVDGCPEWFHRFTTAAYYTGMRRGELVSLSRKQVDLANRMIRLRPEDTKEAHWKRVPIHRDLVPILEECLKIRSLGTDRVFLIQDRKGTRPVNKEGIKSAWRRRIEKLDFDPAPRFHDIRHTWKTNARRSKMHPEIERAIMGHSQRRRSVHEGYGFISDEEFLHAIDSMTFDHGKTIIWASR
jgi:integrase